VHVVQLVNPEHQERMVLLVQMVSKELTDQQVREVILHRLVYQDLEVMLDLMATLDQQENLEIKEYREHQEQLVDLVS